MDQYRRGDAKIFNFIREILANAYLSVCGAIRLSLVYLAAKNALVSNTETHSMMSEVERDADRPFDRVAELLADLNAGGGARYRIRGFGYGRRTSSF